MTRSLPPIWVVHCRELGERRAALEAGLERWGAPARWMTDFDPDDLPEEVLRARVVGVRVREASVFLKQEAVLRAIAGGADDVVLVLEDDAVLTAAPDEVAAAIAAMPPEADLGFLGESLDRQLEIDAPGWYRGPQTRSMSGMVVRRAAAATLLEAFGGPRAPLDEPVDLRIESLERAGIVTLWWYEPPLIPNGTETGAFPHSLGVLWRAPGEEIGRSQGQRDLGYEEVRPGTSLANVSGQEGADLLDRLEEAPSPRSVLRVFGAAAPDAVPGWLDEWDLPGGGGVPRRHTTWSRLGAVVGGVVTAPGLFVDRGSFSADEWWSVFDPERLWMWRCEGNHFPRFALGDPIRSFPELATCGLADRPDEMASFLVGVLPRLLRLHRSAPPQVPLLWPSGPPEKVLALLHAGGHLAGRTVVIAEPGSHVRADRLTWTHYQCHPSDLYVARDVLRVAAGRAGDAEGSNGRGGVVVVGQAGRDETWLSEVEHALRASGAGPTSVTLVSFGEGTSGDAMAPLAGAGIVVATGGPGLAACLVCPAGATVIEVAAPATDPLPARQRFVSEALGLRHWLALDSSPDTIATAVRAALEEPA